MFPNGVLALAGKEFEAGHFIDGMEEASRLQHIEHAEAYYALAQGFYPKEQHPALDTAWNSGANYAESFGFRAPGVYEALRPHRVFQPE